MSKKVNLCFVLIVVILALVVLRDRIRSVSSSTFILDLHERFIVHEDDSQHEKQSEPYIVDIQQLNTTDVEPLEEEEVAHFEVEADRDSFVDALAFCNLPRTSTRPYNKMESGKKYFTYSPSGGFSNQLIELLTAIVLARQYGRVLLVPPCGGHTSGYWNFSKLRGDFMVPMDTVIDFEYMEKTYGVEMVPLTVQPWLVVNWEKSKKKRFGVHRISVAKENEITTRHPTQLNRFKGLMKNNSQYRLLFAHGRFYSKHWTYKDRFLFRHVRYAPYLRNLARTIVSELFGEETQFVAVHIRLGDTQHDRKSSAPNSNFLRNTMYLAKESPMYVLTDAEKDDPFLDHLKGTFSNITFAADLNSYPVIDDSLTDLKNRLIGNRIFPDLFGMVEELIAVQADWFLGTMVSTFARSIVVFRENMGHILPEVNVHDEIYKRKHLPRLTGLIDYGGREMAYFYHNGFLSNSTEVIRCVSCSMLF